MKLEDLKQATEIVKANQGIRLEDLAEQTGIAYTVLRSVIMEDRFNLGFRYSRTNPMDDGIKEGSYIQVYIDG